jgi:hypothetical protein
MGGDSMGLEKRCACCGSAATEFFSCRGCDWSTVPGLEAARERLERFRPGASADVYHPHGCFVCRRCCEQMSRTPWLCPLSVFAAGLEPWRDSRPRGGGDAMDLLRKQWRRWLMSRGWPEEVEAYWHRLMAFLEREEEREAT